MPILPNNLSSVKIEDIYRLVDNGIPEGTTLEYKRDTYDRSEEGKKELCKDVSAFANTSGGDIILGIEENKKDKTFKLTGIEGNSDEEILRLEQILKAYVEPYLRPELRAILYEESKYVLIIRVKKSFLGPHFVKKNGGNFCAYSRTSKGVASLDYFEIRDRFRAAETLNERVHQFRLDRVAKLITNETPIPFKFGPKVILHIIPQYAFYSGQRYDIKNSKLHLLYSNRISKRVNFDGVLFYQEQRETPEFVPQEYTQLYHNGIIEAVSHGLLSRKNKRIILDEFRNGTAGDRGVYQVIENYLKEYIELGVEPPFIVFLTLTGVGGFKMSNNPYPIDREDLLMGDIIIENAKEFPYVFMEPLIEQLRNACGIMS